MLQVSSQNDETIRNIEANQFYRKYMGRVPKALHGGSDRLTDLFSDGLINRPQDKRSLLGGI